MDNYDYCLVVNVCRGTARRPRYKYSRPITSRWKFCSRLINSRLNVQYLFVKRSRFSFSVFKVLCDIVKKFTFAISSPDEFLLIFLEACLRFRLVMPHNFGGCIFTARRCICGICCHRVSVCLPVCLSQLLSSTKMAKLRITQTTPCGSPGRNSSFLTPKISAKFQRDHPQRGRQIEMG